MTLTKFTIIIAFILSFSSIFAQTKDSTETQAPFVFVEVSPEYPGGDQARLSFLANNIHYPEDEMAIGIQGTVYVQFVIEKDGSISNTKILRGVSSNMDEEVIRVVKLMPKWKPGTQKGKAVRCQFNMPVRFILQDDSPKKLSNKEKRALKKKQKAEAKAKKE